MDSDDQEMSNNEESIEEAPSSPKKKKINRENDHEYTVFIKNLSFESTNEDLKECFSKFGKIVYALVVRDSVSGHSRGTGFVQFEKKESVEVCLAQSWKVVLQNYNLEILPALPKARVKIIEKENEAKKHESKDSRNLYLLREGMILAGSSASEGVSATDGKKITFRADQVIHAEKSNKIHFS